MTEELTRAAKKPASTAKKKTSSTTAKKKTSSTAAKKKTSSTAAKKKTSSSTAKKKTSSTTAFRVSAAEKKLLTNYRKCNALVKKVINVLAEKGSGNISRAEVEGLTRGGMESLLDDQSDLL